MALLEHKLSNYFVLILFINIAQTLGNIFSLYAFGVGYYGLHLVSMYKWLSFPSHIT